MQVDRNGRLGKGLNITRTMESWLRQPGYPLLKVTRNYKNHSALVRQDRFFISPQFKHRAAKNPCWWVPLTYTCPSCLQLDSSTASRWLTCPIYPSRGIGVPTVLLEKVVSAPGEWLLLNVQHSAPFRVNYDLRNWQLLNKTLSDPKKFRLIHRVHRAQLVDDLFNLAWSGIMDYPMALGILGYLEHEDEYVVWAATLVNFERINNVAKRDHNYRVYKVCSLLFKKGLKMVFHSIALSPELYAPPAGASVQAGTLPVPVQLLWEHDPPPGDPPAGLSVRGALLREPGPPGVREGDAGEGRLDDHSGAGDGLLHGGQVWNGSRTGSRGVDVL